MRLLEARTGREAVKGNLKIWRPWQFKPLELLQGVDISTPTRQHLAQEYLLFCVQSGTGCFQYRNKRFNGQIVDEKLMVIEPGETWTCQLKDVSFHRLSLDPAWLQQFTADMLHREPSLPHFP